MGGAPSRGRRARHPQVVGVLHEAQRHEVHALLDAEPEVIRVLLAQTGRRQRRAGRVDPFVLAQPAPVHDRRHQRLAVTRLDPKLDAPIVQQQAVARACRLNQRDVDGGHPAGFADKITGGDHERLPWNEVDAAALQESGPDLRPGQVLQDGYEASRIRRGRANPGDDGAVGFVRAVREVEADDVDPGVDQFADGRRRTRLGADGGDDLCVTHER